MFERLRIVDVDPDDRQLVPDPLTRDGAVTGLALDAEHLDTPALRELARHLRDEPIEPIGVVVLGHVDHAGVLVDRAGLVDEPPHRLQRLVLLRTGRVRIDLEDVSVWPVQAEPVSHDGLFARQPRSPRGRRSGAVRVGAVHADEAVEQVGVGVHGERRRPARRLPVVRVVRDPDHRAGGDVVALTELVVPDELVRAVRPREDAHAVVQRRCQEAVRHRGAEQAQGLVREAGLQRELGTRLDQAGRHLPFRHDPRRQILGRGARGHVADQAEPPRGGHGAEHAHPQELPAVERFACALALSVPSHVRSSSIERQDYDNRCFASRSTSRAALRPLAPVTPPPGWVPAPHR